MYIYLNIYFRFDFILIDSKKLNRQEWEQAKKDFAFAKSKTCCIFVAVFKVGMASSIDC